MKGNELSVVKVTPNKAKKALLHAMKKRRPIFMWGPPGIGKSDIVKQVNNEFDNSLLIDVRLSLWEPTDIKGIPYFDSNVGKMVWGAPSELPDEEMASKYNHITLFLDELANAAPSVQAAAYQLILNRRVGEYVLPDNVSIVAAGNREGDKGVTFQMPSPLANRFIHIELEVSFDDWANWAVDHRIHKDVIGFLEFSKNDLYDFDPKYPTKSFATPRSWEFVSELLDDDLDEQTTRILVAGSIGEGLANKFIGHRKIAGSLPKPEKVLSGEVTTLDTKEISAMYSLIVSLCYELKDLSDNDSEEYNSSFNNFLKFSMDNFETELVVMGFRLALTKYALPIDPDEIDHFDEFHNKFSKYIRQAQSS